MSKFYNRIRRIYFVFALSFLLFQNASGQVQSENILEKQIKLGVKKGTLFQVYAGLGSMTGIPVGFEAAADFDIMKGKTLQIENGTLREILDSIVEQEPDYKWELRDGVINLYPIRSQDDVIKELLETKIASFSSSKEGGRQEIVKTIEGLDDINTLLNSKQLRLHTLTLAQAYAKDATTKINISDTDLKGILNKVVFESGDSKLWSMYRTEDGNILLAF